MKQLLCPIYQKRAVSLLAQNMKSGYLTEQGVNIKVFRYKYSEVWF